jgi:hypothetical protein
MPSVMADPVREALDEGGPLVAQVLGRIQISDPPADDDDVKSSITLSGVVAADTPDSRRNRGAGQDR